MSGRATAWAPVNIALVKHWGYREAVAPLLPARPSLSLTLEHGAETTVRWVVGAGAHRLIVDDAELPASAGEKAAAAYRLLDEVRVRAELQGQAALVESRSEVPMGAGMASSAAGAAALTLAALEAAGVGADSSLRWCARAGSISALRSLRGGVVTLEVIDGEPLLGGIEPGIELAVVSCQVTDQAKKISSSAGHHLVRTSPYWTTFERRGEAAVAELAAALVAGDLELAGPMIEAEALAMHGVMLTSAPPIIYAVDDTWTVWEAVARWRDQRGPAGYCTLDAGPNPHVICERSAADELERRLGALPEVSRTWISALSPRGATLS